MGTVYEWVEETNIQVFRWKVERLFSDIASEYAFFLFCFALLITYARKEILVLKGKPGMFLMLKAFTVDHLLNPESVESLVHSALSKTNLFFKPTPKHLAEQVSAHLINYRFTKDSLLGPDRPRFAIVVDIDMVRRLDYKVTKNDIVKPGEATEFLNGEEEAESEAEEEDYEFMCHYLYLNEILEGEEDQEEGQMSLDEEVPEEISSEVKDIGCEVIPFLVNTPGILVQPPKLSLHFSDFEKIEPPMKIQLFKGELVLSKCWICGSKVSRGTMVAKLPLSASST